MRGDLLGLLAALCLLAYVMVEVPGKRIRMPVWEG
jgi:hypothetical protein